MKEPDYLLTEDISFEKRDFKVNALAKGEYDNCRFINYDFYNSDLSGIIFSDCLFTGCNLSLVKLTMG